MPPAPCLADASVMTTMPSMFRRAALIGFWALLGAGCASGTGPDPADVDRHGDGGASPSGDVAEQRSESVEQLENAAQQLIFGYDDRSEVGAHPVGDLIRTWAHSTAAIFHQDDVQCSGSTCALQTTPHLTGGVAGRGAIPLCDGEIAVGQPVGATCTAFLVGPDLVATAGHCVTNQTACTQRRFVFDYVAQDAAGTQVNTDVPAADVYQCSEVVVRRHEGSSVRDIDFALVRLDRPVLGRSPLALRTSGSLHTGTPLVTIGAMLGLPLKVSTGLVTKQDPEWDRFETDLDMSQGSSGAPVISYYLQQVEGILVSGPGPEHVLSTNPDGSECARTRVCDASGGCSPGANWITAQYIEEIVAALEGRSCFDKVMNGQESDVDCGGPDCRGCFEGKGCNTADDCYDTNTCEVYECIAGQCTSNLDDCECTKHEDCEDGIECTIEFCNPTTYQCQNITSGCECSYDTHCNDQDACTTDRCNPTTYTCQHDSNGSCAECAVDSDCGDPNLADCVVPSCASDHCSYDYAACECTDDAQCDDGNACTRDLCFVNTRSCIHIDECN